ncbi:archaea-specific SMC-related protein [Haladaptatus sp. NG-WS-4]
MELEQSGGGNGTVAVANIGGISETTVTFSPGVTLLVGRNATNRTSFLQAMMAALGSENVAMKGDADEATVEFTLGDTTYTRQLSRRAGSITTSGDPYLEDPVLADLFAFLLESNEARRGVATNADLRELIMRPVDTEDIETEIDRLVKKRESLKRELDKITELKGDLPELEAERTQLQNQIDEKRAELEAKEAELEAADVGVKETREEKSELESKLEVLRSKRSQLDDVRYDLDTERESLEALRQERQELDAEYNGLPEAPIGEINELESEIDRLRQQKQRFDSEVNELQNVIGFNEEMLADAGSEAFADLTTDADKSVTDQLLDDEVICWTCGSEVAEEQIDATLDQLHELSKSKVSEINALESQIDELKTEKQEFEQAQRDRNRIERQLDELEGDIEQTETKIETLQERRDELTDEIERAEADNIEELEDEDFSAVLDLHKEANQLEYELGRLETDHDQAEADIARLEDRIAEQDDVRERLEEVTAEIKFLRMKIERIEDGAVEQFNEHMETVLELLDYANLDRIWIEKKEREVREGRRKVTKSVFELHVIRTSDSGTAYEDTVDHLSESEREVTGVVFALAGYLAHEVYEQLPFMLLDSLEAIDAERIATLVDYLTNYTGYLLVALLPEDAAELPESYDRITEV